jgi:hypothetical protein
LHQAFSLSAKCVLLSALLLAAGALCLAAAFVTLIFNAH